MRVSFRVEGDPKMGLGHLMRCMALAQGLKKFGHQVFFFMSEDSQQFCKPRTDWVGEILTLAYLNKQAEPKWLVQQCIRQQFDWLILDGYQFDHAYRHSLQSTEFKLAVFDDLNNSGELYADLVINGASNTALLQYPTTAPNAQLAIGQNYQVLRQEFLQVNRQNWSQREHLALMFGGSDPKNLTLKVLEAIQKLDPSMPIKVITGAAYTSLESLENIIQASGLEINHLHDCQNMAQELENTKLAISAAGGSQFELRACAVPAILVVVADNQLPASQEAANQGWCQVATKELGAYELAAQCLSLWQQPDLLQEMHNKALLLPALDGARNIVKLMSDITLANNGNT
ncbi:UDP-2,4-diacetamido-2,4,6-trideoxy-beta-L-altropyranose hydrolase [Paraglaciecola arctica]|uniref:UDP-2,4-diacetamido-2,4, 6-trideoxy-beta-L-altropyranose hydrolase n=1 Tax=Paraglaciecola arctica TaxID=1128911 RepID=UPI001C0652B5|nr:UDP-2,4-diacetamido-2,4,6-trideoxy-beta-L-altropyranose hydrolase [Paraglaciecola arctica]MBU3002100.1 UDP-2,4-diacetamido-2,4,6-trideoxy-beta-L-altropyranose hydrolase [Paraglaciecola arctica]